ncbi:hypothetical protein Pint_05522 [Pistacia integerrima]|uniref:Uncharacterized protein n=1 Tax=Pistacia integerrima TaxID=434235 RepID=A0ACC0Z4W3_9ROSI|nr:hypothetical protein Pint_05522 [Pistacia integerrima]
MQASDRFNINSQLEHLQAKYVGTGHSDLNRFEWAVNIQRDSYASYVGHYPILSYFAIAENESIGREHYNFMQAICLYILHKFITVIVDPVVTHMYARVRCTRGAAPNYNPPYGELA